MARVGHLHQLNRDAPFRAIFFVARAPLAGPLQLKAGDKLVAVEEVERQPEDPIVCNTQDGNGESQE